MYASQIFKVISSLPKPEIHLRRAEGHRRAGALIGSNNLFQGTIITVYEVVHQKTVYTKLGKQTIWFSDAIKEVYLYFPEKQAGRHKMIENKVALHSEILSTDITKSYG